jgi:uncharacterized protein (TIGR02117 family)
MRKKSLYSRLQYWFLAVFLLISSVSTIAFFNAWTFAPHAVSYIAQNSRIDIHTHTKNTNTNTNTNTKDNRFYVAYAVSNGWHTGVIVPAERINTLIPGIKNRFKVSNNALLSNNTLHNAAAYYEIGWGDRGFYEAKEITALMSLQALFNSSGSVMHVVAVNDPAKEFAGSQMVKFCLNEAQLASLEKFIVSSFMQDAQGQIISRRPGLYGDSQFFEGAGTYHFLNSCNTWAAKALRSAGFDLSPTFKLFARQVMNNIDVSDAAVCQMAM